MVRRTRAVNVSTKFHNAILNFKIVVKVGMGNHWNWVGIEFPFHFANNNDSEMNVKWS